MTEMAEKHELQRLIDDLYVQYRDLTDGQVATYIPELAKASPNDFGICIVTEDGRTFEAGDCDRPFTMQSVTKPFTFGMALEELGHEEVWRYVGVEPSGDAFNAIELQPGRNRPYNPMINSGAIATTALLYARWGEDAFEQILARLGAAASGTKAWARSRARPARTSGWTSSPPPSWAA